MPNKKPSKALVVSEPKDLIGRATRIEALPASPETAVSYLTDLSETAQVSTLDHA